MAVQRDSHADTRAGVSGGGRHSPAVGAHQPPPATAKIKTASHTKFLTHPELPPVIGPTSSGHRTDPHRSSDRPRVVTGLTFTGHRTDLEWSSD